MEETIGELGKSLASFCKHLESSCDALNQSVQRRPIPLDSASSTFVQCLNRRVEATSRDLDLLETMSLNTVSFEELLGHCYEVYKKNQIDIQELEDHLGTFGYVPEPEVDLEDEILDDSATPVVSKPKTFDADDILEDSLSLEDLGLSEACLATIASEANNNVRSPDAFIPNYTKDYGIKEVHGPAAKLLREILVEVKEDIEPDGASQSLINLSKDDYETLPSFMKILASWEDLIAAVEKMNSVLIQKQKTKTGNFFLQEDLSSMDLGNKGRSYVLLLVRMNRLVVETIDGLISYRVL